MKHSLASRLSRPVLSDCGNSGLIVLILATPCLHEVKNLGRDIPYRFAVLYPPSQFHAGTKDIPQFIDDPCSDRELSSVAFPIGHMATSC
jgi:hypothetical protein